jgi:hypothetical protein
MACVGCSLYPIRPGGRDDETDRRWAPIGIVAGVREVGEKGDLTSLCNHEFGGSRMGKRLCCALRKNITISVRSDEAYDGFRITGVLLPFYFACMFVVRSPVGTRVMLFPTYGLGTDKAIQRRTLISQVLCRWAKTGLVLVVRDQDICPAR